ncbi:MAG: MFS transporter [Myxococcaceae bacterium]|nr:MFS transporter [Myxococcaceae bacterium]
MSGPPPAAGPTSTLDRPAAPGAMFALVVLTLMNLLNYVDRWVPSAVKALVKKDLDLTDAETSWPLTAFVFVYMIASPVFGALAETKNRRVLIAIGVAAWSIATAAAGLSQGFWTLLVTRALVGVGEAAYATLAPSLLADFFPPEKRNRAFTVFYVAIPVGSALGFAIGGLLGTQFGWRTAFYAVGLPGLAVAALALLMKDPVRGAFDDTPPREVSFPEALRLLARNPVYVVTVAGYTLVTFATGGIGDWFAEFLHRVRGMDLDAAALAIGASAVVGGLLGTSLGGFVADRAVGRTRHPYLAVSGLFMVPATVLVAVALFAVERPATIIGLIVAAQIFVWAYNAPVNALLVNSVEPSLRARAFGISILCIHALGDAISPPIIGLVSDSTGNLLGALAIVPVMLGLGAVVWIAGWRLLKPPDPAER